MTLGHLTTLKKHYKTFTSTEKKNRFGGGVAIFIQNHISVKQSDLTL